MESMFNVKKMRDRFAKLRGERDAIEAKLNPLHAELEALRTNARTREAELAAEIKKIRAPMVEIDKELQMITGALKGKTGHPKPGSEE